MGARTPEQIDELMLIAYESMDAEAIADLYEDDAIFSNPPDGWTVVGRAAIFREAERDVLDDQFHRLGRESSRQVGRGRRLRLRPCHKREWASLADGTQYEAQGRTTTVAHRGSDGNWRYVIDHSSTL